MGLLLAVLASLLALVQAQCNGPSITITTNADIETISSCSTYNGNIIISPSFAGNVSLGSINTISGDLTATNVSFLNALSAPDLTTIGGTFELTNLLLLATLDVPALTSVTTIRWTTLPILQGVGFEAGLSQADNIHIFNTGLLNLAGFGLTVADTIDVTNNPWLETVDFQDLENVTNILSFQANAPNLNLQFESLQFVFGNMTFRNISALSTPDLQNVTGSFTCHSCSMATYKSTWLQTVGLQLAFVSTDLSSLEFPDLVEVGGGLQLSNNSNLHVLDGFDMLEAVGGGMTLNGNFDSITFGDLGYVKGSVVVETTSNNETLCDFFNGLKHEQIIRDQLICQTGASTSQTTNSSTTLDTSNPTSPSLEDGESQSLSAGAIAGIVVGVLMGIAILIAGAFVLFRRKKKGKAGVYSKEPLPNYMSYPELPQGGTNEKIELFGSTKPAIEVSAQNGYDQGRAKAIPGLYEAGDHAVHASELSDTSPLSPLSPEGQQ